MHFIKLIKWATSTVLLLVSSLDILAAPEDLAAFYQEREEQFLNVKITVRIEEGFSTIPQDSESSIDSSKTFFTRLHAARVDQLVLAFPSVLDRRPQCPVVVKGFTRTCLP